MVSKLYIWFLSRFGYSVYCSDDAMSWIRTYIFPPWETRKCISNLDKFYDNHKVNHFTQVCHNRTGKQVKFYLRHVDTFKVSRWHCD